MSTWIPQQGSVATSVLLHRDLKPGDPPGLLGLRCHRPHGNLQVSSGGGSPERHVPGYLLGDVRPHPAHGREAGLTGIPQGRSQRSSGLVCGLCLHGPVGPPSKKGPTLTGKLGLGGPVDL